MADPVPQAPVARLDHGRSGRTGEPEVVYGEGKPPAVVAGLLRELLADVGVAGVHRILDERPRLASARVIIVVAGMEGALPSVVGGLVSCPVIAVPTSVGYGAAFDGLAALLGMVNSCAPGISVVNIDNGFGAALVARRTLLARTAST